MHELAREKDPKLIPPLAQMYLDGEGCNGLGDLFYVLAVTIKRLKDSKVSPAVEFEAYTTLVTLLSDSGLPEEAEKHLQKALTLQPDRPELKIRGGESVSQWHLCFCVYLCTSPNCLYGLMMYHVMLCCSMLCCAIMRCDAGGRQL